MFNRRIISIAFRRSEPRFGNIELFQLSHSTKAPPQGKEMLDKQNHEADVRAYHLSIMVVPSFHSVSASSGTCTGITFFKKAIEIVIPVCCARSTCVLN